MIDDVKLIGDDEGTLVFDALVSLQDGQAHREAFLVPYAAIANRQDFYNAPDEDTALEHIFEEHASRLRGVSAIRPKIKEGKFVASWDAFTPNERAAITGASITGTFKLPKLTEKQKVIIRGQRIDTLAHNR